jgi:hypothetical protein
MDEVEDAGTVLSRPTRLAARLRDEAEEATEQLFRHRRVLVRLQPDFCDRRNGRETFLLAVNEVIRFCPNVVLSVSRDDILQQARDIATRVHGDGAALALSDVEDAKCDAIVSVGTQVLSTLAPSVTVNSTGWVGRIATSLSGCRTLPHSTAPPNAIGSSVAACLAAAETFFTLIERPRAIAATEVSLFSREVAVAGTLDAGPPLPRTRVELKAFLVGCGGVGNGWAYTVKRLPIRGRLQAIDRQSLRVENLGSYVASGSEWVGHPKADMIASLLYPQILVEPRGEEWDLFKIRLKYGIEVPPVVVIGVDNVGTRHSVQRLWPELIIDMAAGGLTSQIVTKPRRSDGICLLGAFIQPTDESNWAERAARATGLSVERIIEGATTPITESDILAAPLEKRPIIERARNQGQLICGRVTDQNLNFESMDPNFAAAVPFVTAFSGVVAAAATMKWLMGYRTDAAHFQWNFESLRGRSLKMRCDSSCECNAYSA